MLLLHKGRRIHLITHAISFMIRASWSNRLSSPFLSSYNSKYYFLFFYLIQSKWGVIPGSWCIMSDRLRSFVWKPAILYCFLSLQNKKKGKKKSWIFFVVFFFFADIISLNFPSSHQKWKSFWFSFVFIKYE